MAAPPDGENNQDVFQSTRVVIIAWVFAGSRSNIRRFSVLSMKRELACLLAVVSRDCVGHRAAANSFGEVHFIAIYHTQSSLES